VSAAEKGKHLVSKCSANIDDCAMTGSEDGRNLCITLRSSNSIAPDAESVEEGK
jgi:hypothetical protein